MPQIKTRLINKYMSENKFPESLPESQDRSLALFHHGQEMALQGNTEDAIKEFEECISSSKDPEWTAYIFGTVAYLHGDIDALRKQIPGAGRNTEVLNRLAEGLTRRGSQNYKEDYEI